MDQTCMIWDWDITKNSVECVHICKGHKGSVEAIGINHDKMLMATGAWDNMLYIWSTCKYSHNRKLIFPKKSLKIIQYNACRFKRLK